MFVHGSPGSWKGWIRFIEDRELSSSFKIVVVDRLGFGQSDYGVSESSIGIQADALYEVIKTENLKDTILIGHSLGGAVIARMAINHNKDISGLVFVASSVAPYLEKTKWYQYPASWPGIKNIIPTDLRVCNEEIMTLKSELEKMDSLWSTIKANVVIVHGMQDELVPPPKIKTI